MWLKWPRTEKNMVNLPKIIKIMRLVENPQ